MQIVHRRQDRGLHGSCSAAPPGRRAGQGAHVPGASHAEGTLYPSAAEHCDRSHLGDWVARLLQYPEAYQAVSCTP